MSANELPKDAPTPRLAHLVKWNDFDGYGFNLHAEKTKIGQYIGKVDEGSPAEAAGLRTGDRIVEVNDVNISNENHRQVVERIKAIPNETKLLVVDEETDKWYKQHKLIVKGKQPNVKYIKAPSTKQEYQKGITVNGNDQERRSSKEQEEPKENGKITENSIKPCENGKTIVTPKSDRKDSFHSDKDDGRQSSPSGSLKSDEIIPSPKSSPKETDSVKERPKSAVESTSSNSSTSGGSRPSSVNGTPPPATRPVSQNDSSNLNLNMTASEMRALLASRKKYDPKKENIDLRKKYAIIQEM